MKYLWTITLLVPLACNGSTVYEAGAALCSDGRDNDGDQLVDCRDPGCFGLAFCSPRPDASVPDGAVVKKDGAPIKDGSVADQVQLIDQNIVDQLQPDQPGSTSSFGARCTFSGTQGVKCPDGITECIPSKAGGSIGLCTHPCAGTSSVCPPGPAGTKANCFFTVTWPPPTGNRNYCVFACPSCPHDSVCMGGNCY